jgi:hypothetical protein
MDFKRKTGKIIINVTNQYLKRVRVISSYSRIVEEVEKVEKMKLT